MTLSELAKHGLTHARVMPAWLDLCDPSKRALIDWTPTTLPTLGCFMEAFFFGGLKTNYPLEQNFSTFGAHVEDEQDALLKEATVNHHIRCEVSARYAASHACV